MQILVSGSLAYDRIMDFPGKFSDHILPDKLHVLNVSFMVNGLQEKFGGTAGNIAYSLCLLGEKPLIFASAGKDFGPYETWLISHGLCLDGIRLIPEEFTAGAYITTDAADNQITGFNPGAMKFPSGVNIESFSARDHIAIISPGNIEDMQTYSQAYKANGIKYIFDPGQAIPALSSGQLKEMIDGSEILISNDYELELIIRTTGLSKTRLLTHTQAIITTLGEQGSVILADGKEIRVPVTPAKEVKDPTGAGDAYRAGLLKGLATNQKLEDCARMGSVCAAYAVACYGTQEHNFSEEQFWAGYRASYGSMPSL